MNRTPMSQSYVNSQAGSSIGQDQQQQQQQQQQASNSDNNNNNNNNNNSNNNNNNNNNNGINSNNNGQQQQTMNMMIGSSGEQMSQMTSLLLEFAFSAFVNKPHDIVEYAAQYFDQLRSQRGSTGAASQVHQQQQRSDSLGGPGGGGTKRASSDSQRSNLSQNSFTNEAGGAGYQTTNSYGQASEDEFEAYDQGPTELGNSQQQQQQQQLTNHDQSSAGGTTTGAGPPVFKPKTSYNRRKSVFAEAYDPAADQEDDENNRIVHGKTDEQRQRLAKAIKSIFLFRSVDPQDMTQILDAMFEVKVSPGDVVIRQGDDGDNFYVVERGKFQIYYTTDDGQRQVRGEYEDNGFFGELALMYNQPRAATVVAMSSGSLWAMDRKTFRRIVLKSAFKKRKEYEALFEKVGVLQCLNGYERMNLCDALESKRFLNGQMIIVQGDQANGMYFIESGNVKIVKQMDDGRVIDVAILGKGDYFGELALINHKPRAASVYAMGDDVKLAFLDVKAFERLLGSCIERMEKNCAMYLSELAHQEGRQNV